MEKKRHPKVKCEFCQKWISKKNIAAHKAKEHPGKRISRVERKKAIRKPKKLVIRNPGRPRRCDRISSIPGVELMGPHISSGSFGDVYKCLYNGELAAIKYASENEIKNEVGIYQKIKECRNVVKLLAHDSCSMVLKYFPLSLEDYLSSREKMKAPQKFLPIDEIKMIMKNILIALADIHAVKVVHRDLKPSNILIDDEKNICLCDFGYGKLIKPGTRSTPRVGHRVYRAPEILFMTNKAIYTDSVDIWAAGCVFFKLLAIEDLFEYQDERDKQAGEIARIIGTPGKPMMNRYFRDKFSKKYFMDIVKNQKGIKWESMISAHYDRKTIEEAAQLLSKMVCWDDKRRIRADEAIAHNFFQS
jgi:serine/threonine protein kinase